MNKNIFSNHLKITALILLIGLISGCASLSPKSGATQLHYLTWNNRQQQLSKITEWKLDAVSSIHYGKINDIVYLKWHNQNNKYTIDLSGPFNLNASEIRGDKKDVSLWQKGRKLVSAKTPEQLLQREFGFYLPISNLTSWIKALPAPEIRYKAKFDSYNHLVNLTQQNWQITYQDFRSYDGVDLPRIVRLENKQRGINIKIVGKEWEI